MTRFQRYLRAKRTLDDRALDRRLLELLTEALATQQHDTNEPLTVLEVGAGIGTMIARLHEWDIFPDGRIQYTALDKNATLLSRLPDTLAELTSPPTEITSTGSNEMQLTSPRRTIAIQSVTSEISDFLDAKALEWDCVIGAALLDLLDLETVGDVLDAVVPGGSWYFPITFDGGTHFRPAHPADDQITHYYHTHMDQAPPRSSHAGGQVLNYLADQTGVSVRGAAGSDWILRPTEQGYPDEEAIVLEYILEEIEMAVGQVAPAEFTDTLSEWLSVRSTQLAAEELYYFTHQLDLLGTRDPSRLN